MAHWETKLSFYHNDLQGPSGVGPHCASGGNAITCSNVTSTTLLGVSGKSGANKNVSGPRGLRFPFEHRGEPELYLQKRGATPELAASNASNRMRMITGFSFWYLSKCRMP